MSAQNFQLQPSVKDQQTNRTKATGWRGSLNPAGAMVLWKTDARGKHFNLPADRQRQLTKAKQQTHTHIPHRTKKMAKNRVWIGPQIGQIAEKKATKRGAGLGWSRDTISYPVLTDVTGSWLPEKWNSAPKNGLMAQSQALGSVKGIRRHSASSMAGFSFQFRCKMRIPRYPYLGRILVYGGKFRHILRCTIFRSAFPAPSAGGRSK